MTTPPTQTPYTSLLTHLSMVSARPVKATPFTFREAITATLMDYTRRELEGILLEILDLPRPPGEPAKDAPTKATFIDQFTSRMSLPELAHLAHRIVTEVDDMPRLQELLDVYIAGGGVTGTPKNLIFAATGPKPEIVFTDAIDNNVAITRNAEHCLIYEQPISAAGLTYADLITWWRALHPDVGPDDTSVGRHLHARLAASLGSPPEHILFKTYAGRYGKERGFAVPALLPQVYLHYDPYTQRQHGPAGSPLPRQRMDFLILFSDRRRVVLEVDGQQHYSTPDGKPSPRLYAEMVVADRDLRLTGYEIYRFGGHEFVNETDAQRTLNEFFDRLERKKT